MNIDADHTKDAINAVNQRLGIEKRVIKDVGFVESMVPVWGPGKLMVNNFLNGCVFAAGFFAALAVTDIFIVKSAIIGCFRGGLKLGSMSWPAVRHWYGASRSVRKGFHVHHWLFRRAGAVPNIIKNQPFNLTVIVAKTGRASGIAHRAAHGSMFARILKIPRWVIATATSFGSKISLWSKKIVK